MIFAKALGAALREQLETDPRVVLMGEDIADPYGGAFKVTRGLSTDFPDRVRTTPVSEAAITGVAGGLALSGYRPIVEIMFGDFMTLCFDQVVNHISKYGPMYDGQVSCPVVIRTPSGGGRGYGPTHSQSLEKHFLGVPNLRVLAASLWHDPAEAFRDFLSQDLPVLYVEHKSLYPLETRVDGGAPDAPPPGEHVGSPGWAPTIAIRQVPREECSVTVVAYGYQAELAGRVLDRLALEEEIFCELLVPAQLSPIDWSPLERSAGVTGSLLTVEEGAGGWSWGTEVAGEVGRRLFGDLRRPPEVLASARDLIPSAPDLEAEMLVGEPQIEEAVRRAAS